MRIYLDKEGLTNHMREYPSSFDGNYNIQTMYRAVFSDGSSCSCYFGAVGEAEVDEDDESKCHGTYGINFSDDYGSMSEEAHDFVREYMCDAAENIEVPSVESDYGIEPDFDKLNELGEAYTDKLFESMTELTEENQLTYAC